MLSDCMIDHRVNVCFYEPIWIHHDTRGEKATSLLGTVSDIFQYMYPLIAFCNPKTTHEPTLMVDSPCFLHFLQEVLTVNFNGPWPLDVHLHR